MVVRVHSGACREPRSAGLFCVRSGYIRPLSAASGRGATFLETAAADAGEGYRSCTQSGTLSGMAKTVPVREFRTNLSELLSDVADRRDHVLVTRNGKPAAALVPIDEYEALEETAEILSDSVTLAQIEAGIAELTRGESVTLDELRAELTERRASR